MTKIYQLINSEDGTRSECFSAPDVPSLANSLMGVVAKNEKALDFFILVLVEDADKHPFYSRAPLMRVGTFIKNFAPEISENA